ncbi:glucosaminidase domain-containing protein [Clostridium tetanomorphum]|uniref:Mannosyl-glycoprotein endo-beta-N-acetylglucosamidase n=1 Tax=Clostridium tetanomorphum TaxID=1553 RepID=A0A923E9N5_CLOTT|nr:glucosaminidase domain-containing protein [Clostridium tetanomorphum]MBC2396989.1 mannosyl-glycoprotein endo-beta-N-acetylglucosamidase [Clostridium tetanomorphum]NRZ99169.1 flagellum-specific peptidoglycan hydrolase FlgJ [Clostridium tetanomorphum]
MKKLKKLLFKIVFFTIFIMLIFRISDIFHSPKDVFPISSMKIYIKASDEVSKNTLQVNWKYVAAIDAIRINKDFSKSNMEESKKIANDFIEINNSTKKFKNSKYQLLSLEEVMNNLSYDDKEKDKVYKFLEFLNDKYLVNVDENKKNFINELTPSAINIYNNYGILPSITIGQAILESNWGKSDLSSDYNNLFGIKSTKSWKGKTVKMKTSENYNDTIIATFRAYASKKDSLDDYAQFLKNNKRYKEHGVFNAVNYITQATSIDKAGYSTKQDENGKNMYADLLTQIIREYNLQLVDSKTQLDFFKN